MNYILGNPVCMQTEIETAINRDGGNQSRRYIGISQRL